MPNSVIYKNVIGQFPVRGKAWTAFTTAEINENLLYFIGLIVDNTSLELKTDLTIDDRADCETHGNIYFLGFPNVSNAVFCVYRTRYNNTSSFTIAFDFVNRDNQNIQQPNWDRWTQYPSQYGFAYNFDTGNTNIFGMPILNAGNLFYIAGMAQQTDGAYETLNNSLNYARISTNQEDFGCFMKGNKLYKFRQYAQSPYPIFFIDPDIRIGQYSEVRFQKDYIKNIIDINKNYLVSNVYLYLDNTRQIELLPSEFVFALPFNYGIQSFGNGNIMKLDDKYYLCVGSYGNDANLMFCLGTDPVIFE